MSISGVYRFPALGPLLQVTDGTRAYHNPTWLRDGSLLIRVDTDGRREILRLPPGGSAEFRSVFQTSDTIGYLSVCPDGRTILFDRSNPRGGGIWRLDLETGEPVQITTGRYDHRAQCEAGSQSMVYTTGDDSRWIPMRAGLTGAHAEPVTGISNLGTLSPDRESMSWYRFEEHEGRKERGISVRTKTGTKWFATGDTAAYTWSPDSKALLFVRKTGRFSNIWKWPLDGDAPKQLTDYQIPDVWSFAPSPDMKRFAITRGKFDSDVVALRGDW